jgi:hypothetical protein
MMSWRGFYDGVVGRDTKLNLSLFLSSSLPPPLPFSLSPCKQEPYEHIVRRQLPVNQEEFSSKSNYAGTRPGFLPPDL